MLQKLLLPLLLILVSSVYFFTANGRAIFDDGDALYAHIAQNMMRSGDWVTPYVDGVRFLDKPPMMFWLMAISYRVLGVSEFAARLPSVLAILGTCVLLYLMAKKAGSRSSGFLAGLIAAFCIGTFLFTRLVFPDMVFVFFLTLSLWAFLEWYSDEKNPLLPALLFYASLAGAVLTKGLIGLVFPLAIIFLFLAWSRCLSRLRYFHLWKGTLLFSALALPWHLLAAHRNPGFLWYFFVNEQFLRFIGKRQPADYQSIPLPIFWALILVWLFPWSAFFPAIRHILSGFSSRQEMARPAVRLCAIWALVVLVFFSFSSRIEHYSMPLFPPMALLIGIALCPENLFNPSADSNRQRAVARSFSFLGILGGILAVLMLAAVFAHSQISGLSLSLAAAGRLQAYKYYFAPLFDMPAEILNRLEFPFWETCVTLAAGLLGAWWINRRGKRLPAAIILSLMMVFFCFFTFQSLGVCEGILSSKQFGQKLKQLYRSGDQAIVVGDFETANSISFYSPADLEVYGGTAAVLQWGLRYSDAPPRIFSRAQLDERWNSPHRIFLLAPAGRLRGLGLDHINFVMSSGRRTLVCNQAVP